MARKEVLVELLETVKETGATFKGLRKFSPETTSTAQARALVAFDGTSWTVLPAGEALLLESERAKERRRLRARIGRRSRDAALRSLGLTRTPYGWE